MPDGMSEKIDWELTVTTIYCDAIDEEVTLMVNADGTWRCSGHQKYDNTDKKTANVLSIKSKKAGRTLSCIGAGCRTAGNYRDNLLGGS